MHELLVFLRTLRQAQGLTRVLRRASHPELLTLLESPALPSVSSRRTS